MRILLAAALAATTSIGAAAVQEPASAVHRYRVTIANLMQLKPGLTAAEVPGATAVIAPELKRIVGPEGKVIAASFDKKTGVPSLEAASVDAVVLTSALTVTDQHKELFDGLGKAVRPGGVLLVVDVPQENDGKRVSGLEAEDVVKLATAAGFKREAESGIVPGHYAIRFRKG
jgi:predicted methyltransferase